MRQLILAGWLGLALACAALAGAAPRAGAQRPGLTLGGSVATSGVHALRAAFTPDPWSTPVRASGTLDAPGLRLGPGCRGFVSAQPDVIVRFSGASTFVRFFARSTADVTLLVNDPQGRFLCNDDVMPGRDTNPMVDVYQPRPGQYDVWIGTHASGTTVEATLFVTELRTQRP